MKLGILISQTEPETVFNALRLANYSLKQGDAVKIFLVSKGVELDIISDAQFNVKEQAKAVLDAGGEFLACGILACGTCLKLRESEGSEMCPLSTLIHHAPAYDIGTPNQHLTSEDNYERHKTHPRAR
jgi:uncharacterized protein involved in oxidation of intracellular sulfur